MARIPIHDPKTATGSNREIFEALQKALGVVPNMTKVMANAPAVLKSYAAFSAALGGGSLSAKAREQIAVLAAEQNACSYCLSAHTAIGSKLGLNATQLEGARHGKADDPKTAAALRFASRVIEAKGAVSENDVAAAKAGGLSDGELAEVVGNVAINLFTNYFNRAFAVDIDFPVIKAAGDR